MILILIFIILILYFIQNKIYNNEKARLLHNIQGPRVNFLLGNTLDILKDSVKLFYIPRKFANMYDGKYRLMLPSGNAVLLFNPEDIEVLLTSQKNITKGNMYKFIHPWLNTGLLTSTGEKWQNRRKILTPAFHFNILRQFCQIFIEHSEHMVEKLKEINGEEVDVLPFVTNYTLHSISETAMGTKLDMTQKKSVDYKNAIYNLGELLLYRTTRVWLHSKFIFDFTSKGKQQKNVVNTLHTFTMDVINDRRRNRANFGDKFEVEDYTEEKENRQKKRLAMLDLLLSAESDGKIDALGIREEVDTFMFEGHDTTTIAIMFCLMMLANNPDAQKLAYEEVQTVLGNDSKTIGIETLSNLRYLERCIKETMRLYPSVPAFGRKITEDLKLNDHVIPADTMCQVHVFDLHRSAKIYPNPCKFDPDRFLPENCAKRHNFAYIPFSAGPRNCIGQKFAMLEIKTVISLILQNFELKAVTKPDDVIFYADIVLRTKTPVKVKFLSRVNNITQNYLSNNVIYKND